MWTIAAKFAVALSILVSAESEDSPTEAINSPHFMHLCVGMQLATQAEFGVKEYAWPISTIGMQRRYQLALGTPQIEDAAFLPSEDTLTKRMQLLCRMGEQAKLAQQVEKHNFEFWTQRLREIDREYFVFDAARDATQSFYDIAVRRRALHRLRELIGNDNYYAYGVPRLVPTEQR